MLHIGKVNRLEIVGQSRQDFLLEGGKYGDIPIARAELPGQRVGDDVEVFVHIDADGYLAATSRTPTVQAGQVGWLQVLEAGPEGAWLDWGIEPDLFLPRREQQAPAIANRYCLARVVFDERKGLYASTYLNDYISDNATGLETGQPVALLIGNSTELGYKVIVDHRYWGLLYANEVFQPLHKGQALTGYVKKLREDGRLDVTLAAPGFAKVEGITGDILEKLQHHGGFLALSDKSSPEDIYRVFGVSKKVFKQAIGTLFKQRRIVIEPDGIRLA